MKKLLSNLFLTFTLLVITITVKAQNDGNSNLKLLREGYFGRHGFDVMVFNNNYAQGHQGGVEVIQHGERIATVGDLRLNPTPGQWSPLPKLINRTVDRDRNTISATLVYPDSSRNQKGFNPIKYPDLYFKYHVHVKPAPGNSVIVTVDLEKPLPEAWVGRVGFNMELFPGMLFGKAFMMDGRAHIFPRHPTGDVYRDHQGKLQAEPIDTGRKLVIAPESKLHRLTIESDKGDLQLLDSRLKYNNGWFVVRGLIPKGAVNHAIQWKISGVVNPEWRRKPVIQVSQLGYELDQRKKAVIETDSLSDIPQKVQLKKVTASGSSTTVLAKNLSSWGKFLRYNDYTFDFSEINEPGLYYIQNGKTRSHTFRIKADIYNDQAWQSTLEYFLPVQMCHMLVRDKYRVWHGRCHLDDALMAPVDTNHFDGYKQGSSTLTKYNSYEHVPGLNAGGWHDAGDYDLRVESQAGTVYKLALMYEHFKVDLDQTTIDESSKVTEIHQPDGKPDVLQQMEHGLLTILGGYENLGRLYRGIICNNLNQYVLLGDGSNMTDNQIYHEGKKGPGMDDRWVFTEQNPGRALYVTRALAAAGRVLRKFDPDRSARSLKAAREIFKRYAKGAGALQRTEAVNAAVELYESTGDDNYLRRITDSEALITKNIGQTGWMVSQVINTITNKSFKSNFRKAMKGLAAKVDKQLSQNPYGVPYNPAIWGAGWNIESFGVEQYFLHQAYPELFPKENFLNALNYVLGVHQGADTQSYVSAVGRHSATTAYGFNRADWSYIPGGVISGTGLILPNFPELKKWPYLWQQTEYVMGGAATNFMFLSLAADDTFN